MIALPPDPAAGDSLLLLLWSKSWRDPSTGCRLWLGASNGRYGYQRIGRAVVRVHRLGWALETGQAPPPILHHTCHRPLCWEPQHLCACSDQRDHFVCHWRFRRALLEMDARYRYLVTKGD